MMKQHGLFLHSLILQLFYLFLPTIAFANGDQCLVAFLKSGIQISIPIAEQPKITFNGNVMRIGDGDYQIENVRKWMIGDPELVTVEGVKSEDGILFRDGILSVNKTKDVHIYNTAGMKMSFEAKSSDDGKLCIDFSAWPQDIYIIKVGNETIKIRKR